MREISWGKEMRLDRNRGGVNVPSVVTACSTGTPMRPRKQRLAFLLAFGFALVMVAGQTVLNDRVPLSLRGRVLSTQGAMAALAASVPVLAAGALVDIVGVQPVMAALAGVIGVAAVFNLRT